MPTYHIETNQGTYEIEANQEPTDADIQNLVAGGMQMPTGQQNQSLPPTAPQDGPSMGSQLTSAVFNAAGDALPVPGIKEGIHAIGNALTGQDVKKGLTNDVDNDLQVEAPTVAMGLGGPGAAAGTAFVGNGLVQIRKNLMGEQQGYKPGEAAKDTLMAAVPMSKAAGIAGALSNAGRMAAAGAGGEEARSLIDDGQTASAGQLASAAASPLASVVAGHVISSGLGKLTNNVDPGDAAAMAALQKSKASRDAVNAAGQDLGLAVVPSSVNPSVLNTVLESMAGRGGLKQGAMIHNQEPSNVIARGQGGLGADVPVTQDNLDSAGSGMMGPYDQIQAIKDAADAKLAAITKAQEIRSQQALVNNPRSSNPMEDAMALEGQAADSQAPAGTAATVDSLTKQAGADIDALRSVRAQVARLRSGPYNPDNAAKADAMEDTATDLQGKIAAGVAEAGQPQLAQQMIDSRQLYAKNRDVAKVVVGDSGNINAQKVGAMVARNPGKYTGDFKTLGDFQLQNKNVIGNGSAIQDPASTGTNLIGPITGAIFGHGLAGKVAAAGVSGAVAAARAPIRAALYSKPYQTGQGVTGKVITALGGGARPDYSVGTQADPAVTAAVIKALVNQQNAKK